MYYQFKLKERGKKIDVDDKDHQLISLDNLLEILGNPTRRVILSKLAKVPHSASELARALSISRQAVHSQLENLIKINIIDKIGSEKRGGKYRIKSNLDVRINISPDYYNIKYNLYEINDNNNTIEIKDITLAYARIKPPNLKIRFLGESIKQIEQKIKKLELERRSLLQNKECFIVELKNIMEQQYNNQFMEQHPDLDNLEREIFFTLFFNPERYHQRINIDNLLEDLFFSDISLIRRDQHKVSIRHLLRDLSKVMDFLHEDDDDWFFDI